MQARLDRTLEHYLADYAKKEVWDPTHAVRPVASTDPVAVQFCKASLLLLSEAEGFYKEYSDLGSAQPKAVASPITREIPSVAQSISLAAQTLVIGAGKTVIAPIKLAATSYHYGKSGISLVMRAKKIVDQISVLRSIITDSEMGQALAPLQKSLTDLQEQVLHWQTQITSGEALASDEQDLPALFNKMLSKIAVSYFETDRPAAPLNLEQKVDAPVVPVVTKPMTPNPFSSAWSPNALQKHEWLPTVNQLRTAIRGTKSITELLDAFIQDAKERGMALDDADTKAILATLEALKNASLDSNGYYDYKQGDTPLSQTLKALFNTLWSVNELCGGLWDMIGKDSSILERAWGSGKLTANAPRALQHILKIDWVNLGPGIGAITSELSNLLLTVGTDTLNPILADVAHHVHAIELDHHLRFGSLSEGVRPALDGLEKSLQERGLFAMSNPLGYSETEREDLEKKLADAKKNQPKFEGQLKRLNMLLTDLSRYAKTNPRTIAIQDIAHLHQRLVDLSANYVLSKEDRETIRAIQTILSEHKEDRAKQDQYVAGAWRAWLASNGSKLSDIPAIGATLAIIENQKKALTERLMDIPKYQEAIQQHEKMRTEFALRSLRSNGLISLINAVKNSASNPAAHLIEKRRLAVLLADIAGTDRQHAIQNAHQITTDFIDDPKKIDAFISTIYSMDAGLANTLVIEGVLAGYINSDCTGSYELLEKRIGSSANYDSHFTDIIDRLSIKAIIDMMEEINLDRFDLLRRVLGENSKATRQQKTREEVISLLCSRYHDLERRGQTDMQSKIAILLGRLAAVDEKSAQIIFSTQGAMRPKTEAATILETSKDKHKALYFEGMVNALQLNYVDGKAVNENRTLADFARDNQSVFEKIYQAVGKHYTDGQSPIELMETTEYFIRHYVSKGSVAEKKLSEFFSSMVLCTDNVEARLAMLERYQESSGSPYAKYLERLTHDASFKFFEITCAEFEKYKITFINEMIAQCDSLRDGVAFGVGESHAFCRSINQLLKDNIALLEAVSAPYSGLSAQYNGFQELHRINQGIQEALLEKKTERTGLEAAYKEKIEREAKKTQIEKRTEERDALVKTIDGIQDELKLYIDVVSQESRSSIKIEKINLANTYARSLEEMRNELSNYKIETGFVTLKTRTGSELFSHDQAAPYISKNLEKLSADVKARHDKLVKSKTFASSGRFGELIGRLYGTEKKDKLPSILKKIDKLMKKLKAFFKRNKTPASPAPTQEKPIEKKDKKRAGLFGSVHLKSKAAQPGTGKSNSLGDKKS